MEEKSRGPRLNFSTILDTRSSLGGSMDKTLDLGSGGPEFKSGLRFFLAT